MLEAIRQLTRTVKLKELIMNNFMPDESIKGVENRTKWSDTDDCWLITVSSCFICCIFASHLCITEIRVKWSQFAYEPTYYEFSTSSC